MEVRFKLEYTGRLSVENLKQMQNLDKYIRKIYPCKVGASSEGAHFVPLALTAFSYIQFTYDWAGPSESETKLEEVFTYLIVGRLFGLVDLILQNIRSLSAKLETDEIAKDTYTAAVLLYCLVSTISKATFPSSTPVDHVSQELFWWSLGLSFDSSAY